MVWIYLNYIGKIIITLFFVRGQHHKYHIDKAKRELEQDKKKLKEKNFWDDLRDKDY